MQSLNNETIPYSIKTKREKLGLTQKDFADALGLPGKFNDRTLRRWENGETSPSIMEYKSIMKFASDVPFAQTEIQKEQASFLFIDLFAGIGGIRIPFQELGGYCVFSSEWDKFSQKTYKANFGEIPHGDITKIDSKDIPDFDILLAGFPCQPFSQAGLKKGFEDTRGTLFFEIERIISDKRPKAFLLENVKQLKGHDRGRTLETIKRHLEALDYYTTAEVLRSGDFGLPQNRERLYIVGFDKRQFDIPSSYSFKYPVPPKIPTRLGDILQSEADEKYTISNKLFEGHLRRKQEHAEKGNGFGFSLFTGNSVYVNTLSARYYKDGSEILIDQGSDKPPRKLTPRECARLQGFPDKYIIPVSDTQSYKQFGNSVAIPAVRAVATRLLEEMNNFENR